MELASSLRQGVKAVVQRYETGVWLDEFAVAWEIVHRQSRLQRQAACLQAGYPDALALVKSCAFCQVSVQPEAPHRPMVRYEDPVPKLEGLARHLRAEACDRYEHASASEVTFELCRQSKVSSLDHFCVALSAIPTLHQLTDLNNKISDFAAAYVGAR